MDRNYEYSLENQANEEAFQKLLQAAVLDTKDWFTCSFCNPDC